MDQIFDLIEHEKLRQLEGIELIASENFASQEVMNAMGSVLTNKYAEGLPSKRYYGGCEVVDKVENCYPMIPSGKPHNQMLLGPEDEKEEVSDEGKTLV